MSGPAVGVIVLAAGSSSRLGQPKQLLPVDGQPLLSRTLDVVRATTLEPRIVVLGGYSDEIRSQVNFTGFEIVENPDYLSGQSTSLQAGLRALPDDTDGVIVLLGDQPQIPAWLLTIMAEAFSTPGIAAVRPRYADGPGNPVLLSKSLFPDLLALEGDVGARDVLQRHRDAILEIDYRNRPAPGDVDTMEDYRALLRDWASTGSPYTPRFCQQCGAEVAFRQLYGRLRPVCPECNFTYLYDPKVVVATIVESHGRIVMHRRTVNPGAGKWTFPSGFVDRGEQVEEAARREVLEEVGLQIHDLKLVSAWSVDGSSAILLVFQATAEGQEPAIGDESSDARWFDPQDLPELAFPRDAEIVAGWLASREH